MKAVLCPVCNGNGQVSQGFYSHPGDYPYYASGGVNLELCRSCNGKGWIEVKEDEVVNNNTVSTLTLRDWDKCPACGGDRNSPAGTGCPMGSHYGSYCEEV